MMAGEVLTNNTNHRREKGRKTTSIGFCFFPEDPDKAINWLCGIVDDDVCATFDVPDKLLRQSKGTYCDDDESDNSLGACLADIFSAMMGGEMENCKTVERVEYCCKKYSIKDFRLIDYKYSERLLRHKQCNAEWERNPEELPEGVLLQGTTTEKNILWASHKIGIALEKTPLCHGSISADMGCYGTKITLPDGRVITPYQRVEVHDDGIVLIDGRLLTDGFPALGFDTGTGNGEPCYYLQLRDGLRLEVPETLWKKYQEALRNWR